jgi:hypothetical protein
MNKPHLLIILKEEVDYCAKCCKTQQVIERMLSEIPVLKEEVKIDYENITSNENAEKFSGMTPPILLLNNIVFSEGHVPIIKKLSRELLNLIRS